MDVLAVSLFQRGRFSKASAPPPTMSVDFPSSTEQASELTVPLWPWVQWL
jgi:hypothetical protein